LLFNGAEPFYLCVSQQLWFRQLASSFSFQQPKENGTKRKGRPTSLKTPHSGVFFRHGSTRHPWLKRTSRTHPVRSTRKITPPIGSEERG